MKLLTLTLFSAEHYLAVLVGIAITLGILWWGRRSERGRMVTSCILAFLNLSAYAYSQAAWLSLGEPIHLDSSLPFHLCDVAAIIAGFALITRNHLLCSLTYCWGLAATVQALITPALGVGFPSWPYFTFFIHHFAVVAAALYIPIVLGWRPKRPIWRTPLNALLLGIAYQMLSLGINALLDTNFGFSMRKPISGSMLDHLGAWPWYLMVMWPIAFTLFFLLCLPFVRGKKSAV